MQSRVRHNRAVAIHLGFESALENMRAQHTKAVPLAVRRGLTRSLIELKRNREGYDFGPTQLKILDTLINLSRKANTYEQVQTVHRLTCNLGLGKH